ncbi:MAG: bifunctional proline dehydrogenase/L-glutamate gamma-semialdehyde dehydrogenase PutA [Pseudomonadota bacterium]
MQPDAPLQTLREIIRDNYLTDEAELAQLLVASAGLSEELRKEAQGRAAEFVTEARASAERSGLIDKFLQEYGLSTAEGVTLMRLAEALLRTPDAATADALIEDKIEAGDWGSHKGKSPFPLVNFSTRALMLTAAWLDDIEAKDPLTRMAVATKAALDKFGEPVIRASVAQAMRIMGEHFVLGQTIDEAMKRAKKFAAKGYGFSFDMLGEAAHTDADAQKYFRDYKNAIAAIAIYSTHERAADNPGISVKLSALHPRYEYGKKERVLKELGARVRELALDARAANMGFNIDAEEADRLDLSLDIIESLMRDPALADWNGFGVVVQAYQRRASFVLDWLATISRETGRRIMVRLVKGAYWDSEIKRAQVMGLESYPVFTRKVLTDLNYLACARKLFASTDVFYPQFATHNALTATMVQAMSNDCEDYELQRLHGMGEALHDSLLASGARSRIYAPVGGHKELLPYLVRRLLENGANSSFVNQLIDPDLSVDDIVADPIDELAAIDDISNPNIPAPRDHLNGERLASKGWDETHPPMAAHLEKVVAQQHAASQQESQNRLEQDPQLMTMKNPATGFINGFVNPTTKAELDAACKGAETHQPAWAARSDRGDILRKAADMLEENADDFMRIATQEAGKSIPDAIAEVREAVDFLRYYADRAEELSGDPLGVVACISPWNFPLAIFLGQVSAALAAGNAAIAKPAEQTPSIAGEAVRLMHLAGVPENVLHIVYGDGPDVGAPLVAHPAVNGVIFTGSTPVAQLINRTLTESGKHDATLIAETGGINAMIVDSTALLEQAVTDTVSSAFQSAGQRCSACRLVCVQDDIADRFMEMLAGAMKELSVGNPSQLSTDVGPVIDEEAHGNIQKEIDRLEKHARLIARAPALSENLDGTFILPAAFEINAIGDLKQETFGPLLHVVRFKASELEDLIDEINALGFGLTMGIHTRIDETMHTISRRARIGNVYVNRNQIGAVVGVQPFGGEGLSGTGPKAGGPHYVEALQQCARPNGEDPAPLSDREMTATDESALSGAGSAYQSWNAANRAEIVQSTLDDLASLPTDIRNEISEAARDVNTNTELPGPTGESNTLKLRGRGVVLCLGGGDHEGAIKQIMLALAAGNCVLAIDNDGAKAVAAALRKIDLPEGVFTIIDDAPSAMLHDSRIRAVVFDGGADARRAIQSDLAKRNGAIIPLLSSFDRPWRFATERTLTVNTTAAGGDVRLLSLGE